MAEPDRPRTLRGALAGLGGVVFAASGAALGEPTLGGWGAQGDGPDTVRVQHTAGAGLDGGEVEVETSMVEWSGRPEIVVRQLLGSDRAGPPVFPLSSTVTREDASMRVAGRRRKVALYRCGPRWIVPLPAASRFLTVTGRLVDPHGVEVVSLAGDRVEERVHAAEVRHRQHEARMRAGGQARKTFPRSVEGRRREQRAAVSSMGGPFFAARGPALNPPWFSGGGTSNGVQTSMKIESPGAAGGQDVMVTTMVTERPMVEEIILWRLLGSDLPEPPVFPATSTVHKGKLPMRIAGRRRPVTVYVCGAVWFARTGTAGRRLWIDGYATDPRTIDIVRLDDADVAAVLALSDAVTRWMADRTLPHPLRPPR